MRNQEEEETCQVCFVKPHRLFEYSQIVHCVTCRLACHRSCYNPSLKENRFECDGCQFSLHRNEVCFICGNHGLLKKAQNQFAHPVCLLFSPKAIVLQYSTLTFSLIVTKPKDKHQKKSTCSICKKTGNLQKCYAQCSNEVHMYCAWKSYQEQNGWNHNTIVEKLEYSVYFEKKSKSYLQPVGQTLIDLIGSFSSTSNRKPRQFQLACPQHTDTIFECCTQEKYFHQTQIDYIQCDQCFRWYHKDCLDSKPQSQKNSIFICSQCHNFWKLVKQSVDSEFWLKRFPRLNICELIYVQCLFEKKKYQLTKSEWKLLFSMPIQPSLMFIESLIKRNIISRLKVEHFKSLCKLNLSQRIDKKHFKEEFKKKFEPILTLITQTKSLYELVEKNEKNEEMESQMSLKQEERESLMQWINLLNRFKQGNKVFNQVIQQLVKKLNKWLRSLSKQQEDNSVKSFQQQSVDSSNILASSSVKVQNGQTNEVKMQEMSSQQESEKEETQSQSLSNKQYSSMSQLKHSKQSCLKKNRSKEEEEMEDVVYCDQGLQEKILAVIKMIRKKLDSNKINKQKLTLKILNQHDDKVFFLQTILNDKLPLHSALKVFLLEAALKNILNLIEQHKITQNLLNQDPHEAQTTFSGDTNDRSKIVLKNKTQTKITFVQKFRDKIFEIYFNCQNQIKKTFKRRVQFLFKALDDFIDVLQLQKLENLPKKLTFDEAFEKFIYNPKAEGFSSSLKAQIKSSFDENELKLFRLQIEKKKIYVKIKKIEFTRSSSSHIGREYENYCKSSSEQNDTSNQDIAKGQMSLRKQILGFQKNALEQWIKMFGFTFNLANQLVTLENNDTSIKGIQQSKTSFIDKQPLLTIEEFLSIDYKEKSDLKKSVFRLVLIFFCKLKESLINYKVFNPKFVSLVDQMGKFCIDFSLNNVLLWADDQLSLSTMRYLYKGHYKLFINLKSQQTRRFREVWSIFETDELYSSYLQENKHLLFRDPQITEQTLKKKIPQMLSFYEKTEFICRVKQLRRMRIWICYYLKCLELIGAQHLVEKQFMTQSIKQRYEQVRMLSFNQLAIMINELHKVKFPQGVFASKIIGIFNKAIIVESEIQSFFDKSSICLDESYASKEEFQAVYDIQKDCFSERDKISEEKGCKISSSEYKMLISLIADNEVSEIITFELEKYAILDQRNAFKRCAIKAQQIIKTKNQSIPIRQLNLIYFEIRSYPFHYVNLEVFLLFIAKKVERQRIFGNLTAKMKLKEKENIAIIEKAFGEILSELGPNSKMMCRTLTRQQVAKKLQLISQQQAYKQVEKIPSIQKARKLINQKLQRFDKIKNSLSYLIQKVKLNKTLEHEEIEHMDDYISAYKAQKIYEFEFQILSNNVEQYKLAFSAIPDDPEQKLMTLEQLKSLKKPFKTKEYLKKIHELQKKIGKY